MKKISKYCNGVQFEKFFRPVTIHAISEKCKKLTSSKLIISKEKVKNDGEDQTETGIIKPVTGKKEIMVVNDNPIVLRNVKSILDEKYETIVVPSGEKALLLIPQKRPDLVLLDYEMKGIDGRETFEAAAIGFVALYLLYLYIEYPNESQSNLCYRKMVTWLF